MLLELHRYFGSRKARQGVHNVAALGDRCKVSVQKSSKLWTLDTSWHLSWARIVHFVKCTDLRFLGFFLIYLLVNSLTSPADFNCTKGILSAFGPELLRERAVSSGKSRWQQIPSEVPKRKINLIQKRYGFPPGATAIHLLSHEVFTLWLNKEVMLLSIKQ